ncbi:hypothetical protein M5C97_01175 [Acidovorax sp. NCPPB 3859]|nr:MULTISPECIES: hypothetical protein [unclassified Acidovorax]MDA8450010.1 hypothetical protein [Acidovorax sp. GBBC 3297]MDA8459455.1 hypothetical protein [Acidovorax sp. GBBC 3333]MDA8464492.1 hypothetical protein [Acidovorax sp. GBBC 3332]MDA8469297.1 hypothetical protein [Acidovorax sp. GBBC 3299]WCM78934.1 hypothetical protein M5C94_01175 [Acidovorax sp. GBBC 712]
MFNEDAEDSSDRAEQGRRNADCRELYEAIKMAIRDAANFGGNSDVFIVSAKNKHCIGGIMESLEEEGYTVIQKEMDRDRTELRISWHKSG